MAKPDKYHSATAPEPVSKKQNLLITHLPDIVAIGVMSALFVLPSELLNNHYQDQAKYIQEAQSGLLMIKTALASQIPALAVIGFTAYARLTKDKELLRK